MINKDIIDAFKIIAKDKDIETVNLSYIIEELFINLMHKKYGEENNNFIVPNWRSSANSLIVNKGDIIRIIYAANPYMVDTTLLVRPEATESGCKYVINGM